MIKIKLIIGAVLVLNGFVNNILAKSVKLKLNKDKFRVIEHWDKKKRTKISLKDNQIAKPKFELETSYYWLAIEKNIDDELRNGLLKNNVEILGYAGKFDGIKIYKVFAEGNISDAFEMLKTVPEFVNIVKLWGDSKIEMDLPSGKKHQYKRGEPLLLRASVSFREWQTLNSIIELLPTTIELLKEELSYSQYYKRISVYGSMNDLTTLAKLDEVKKVGLDMEKQIETYYARKFSGVNFIQNEIEVEAANNYSPPITTDWLDGIPYTGEGIWVANGEPIDENYLDFYENNSSGVATLRKIPNETFWFSTNKEKLDHGTHTAGIIAGNGYNSATSIIKGGPLQWRGIAPKVLISSSRNQADVHSYSYGLDYRYYNNSSYIYDEISSIHDGNNTTENNIHVAALGNYGAKHKSGPGKWNGYFSVLNNDKNRIKVGMSYKDIPFKNPIGSLGPTVDGRIGPDVCAPGAGTISEKWKIELDEISIKNNGSIKHSWNFNAGESMWDEGSGFRTSNFESFDGDFTFLIQGGGYLYSNILEQADIFTTEETDVLTLKLNVMELSNMNLKQMVFKMYWVLEGSDEVKQNSDGEYSTIEFYFDVQEGMQEINIPFNSANVVSTNGGWVNGDDIKQIRLDFRSNQFDGIIAPHADTDDYIAQTGTSMAAPFVSGVTVLMLEKYRDNFMPIGDNIHENPFWNSTARAILIHTATDMVSSTGENIQYGSYHYNWDFINNGYNEVEYYGPGPDFATGYGLVNPLKAIDYVDPKHYLEDEIAQGQEKVYPFLVEQGAENLRVSLVWDDPPNELTSIYQLNTNKLVNNLDLYLRDLSTGEIHRPWVLDYLHLIDYSAVLETNGELYSGVDPISPNDIINNPARKGIDDRGNVEVVDVVAPNPGSWEIVVKGTDIAEDQSDDKPGITQDFSLVFDKVAERVGEVMIHETGKTELAKDFYGLSTEITIATEVFHLVSKVDFYIDGILEYTDTQAPYEFKWSGYNVGSHSISVMATSSLHNVSVESEIEYITIHPIEPIISSVNHYNSNDIWNNTVSYQNNLEEEKIASIEWYFNGSKIEGLGVLPTQLNWEGPGPGEYQLAVKCYESDGTVWESGFGVYVHSVEVTTYKPLQGTILPLSLDENTLEWYQFGYNTSDFSSFLSSSNYALGSNQVFLPWVWYCPSGWMTGSNEFMGFTWVNSSSNTTSATNVKSSVFCQETINFYSDFKIGYTPKTLQVFLSSEIDATLRFQIEVGGPSILTEFVQVDAGYHIYNLNIDTQLDFNALVYIDISSLNNEGVNIHSVRVLEGVHPAEIPFGGHLVSGVVTPLLLH